MSMSDPVGDMLNRISTAVAAGHLSTSVPSSKLKTAIARILQEEGYIDAFDVIQGDESCSTLQLNIRYIGERRKRRPIITGIKRVSRPGRRVYTPKRKIPRVLSGLGIAIVSTPKGVMTGRRARRLGVGGEVLCHVW